MPAEIETMSLKVPQSLSMVSRPGGRQASAIVEGLTDAMASCEDMRLSLGCLMSGPMSPANYESAADRDPDVAMVTQLVVATMALELLLRDARDRICSM